jgi:hypothetical protein
MYLPPLGGGYRQGQDDSGNTCKARLVNARRFVSQRIGHAGREPPASAQRLELVR